VLRQIASPSRRFNSRIATLGAVWVYWRCSCHIKKLPAKTNDKRSAPAPGSER
jgi:hypothetical protein